MQDSIGTPQPSPQLNYYHKVTVLWIVLALTIILGLVLLANIIHSKCKLHVLWFYIHNCIIVVADNKKLLRMSLQSGAGQLSCLEGFPNTKENTAAKMTTALTWLRFKLIVPTIVPNWQLRTGCLLAWENSLMFKHILKIYLYA